MMNTQKLSKFRFYNLQCCLRKKDLDENKHHERSEKKNTKEELKNTTINSTENRFYFAKGECIAAFSYYIFQISIHIQFLVYFIF